mmetsp:Transcript_30671/g.52384  ORF Transcript_30671/g.52384 Transcript_30671/m.52384 type:complete len:205 (-) Transcript_30671:218-832(-)
MRSARKDGVVSMRNVCPVGAVSNTTRSKLLRRTSWMTLARATTSSVPAGRVSMISPREFRVEDNSESVPLLSLFFPMSWSIESRNSFNAEEGSISMAFRDPSSRPVPPGRGGTPYSGTSTRDPPCRFISRASPKLCAGSVLTTATSCPAAAMAMANEELVVVLPTPPFPPQMTIFGLFTSGSVSSRSNPINLPKPSLPNICVPR